MTLYDAKLEATAIATLIAHPDFLLVENNLRPTFFYEKENQCLVWAIQTLVTRGVEVIDALNIETVIQSNAAVKRIMDEHGLADLTKYIELSKYAARGSYEEYKVVEDQIITYAFRRELQTFSIQLGNQCENLDASLEDLNDFCNDGLTKIVDRYAYGADSVLLGDKIDRIWSDIVDKRSPTGYGLPFKIEPLNDYCTLVPGELTLVMGATGRGKSSFFLSECLHKSIALGVPTLLIDTELTDLVWFPRAVASVSGVTVHKVKTGLMTPEELSRVKDAIEVLRKAPIIHEYINTFDKFRIEGLVRKWKNKIGLGLVIFDYIKPGNQYGAAEVSQSMGMATDFLKNVISTEISVPVIAGLQQNEQTGTVADSQKPTRYADTLISWEEKTPEMIARDGVESGNFRLQIYKNRNGDTLTGEDSYLDVMFDKAHMRITSAKPHPIQETDPFK
jgi:replicative DNA helicase